MFGPTLTLMALIGLAMLSAGGVAYALLYGRISGAAIREQRVEHVRERSTHIADVKARAIDPAKRRKSIQDTLKEMEERQKAKARKHGSPPLQLRLQQAGLSWSKQTFFIISGACGLFFAGTAFIAGVPLYAVAALGLAGLLGFPRWLVGFLRKRRFKAFLNEFPNAVDVIVRGVKAGLPLNDCVRIIANEAAEPVRSEFRIISEGQGVGLGLAEAVERLPERMPLPEANFFAIVVAIQSKAGGNLSEALGNLSRVLRDRKKMKGKIQAMSMEAKASGAIIGALPVIVMLLVYITSPDYIMLLFTEQVGHLILLCSAAWMALGIFVMKKMINFDF